MPAYGTTKATTSGSTRTYDDDMLCFASSLLAAGAKVGAVIDLGPGETRGDIVLEVSAYTTGTTGGTFAGGTTIILEGSAVVGMTSPTTLATFVFDGSGFATVTIPFTTRPNRLVDAFQFVRMTATLAGADTYTASAWLARSS